MSEILARLCAGTVNIESVGGGGAELTKVELSALLCGLSDVCVNYALAKYCDDRLSFKFVQMQLMQMANQRAMDDGWKTSKGKPAIMSLGALAVIESINPRMCFACNTPDWLSTKICSCGNPRTKITAADRFRYVELTKRTWVELWASRYEQLFNYCQMIDSEVNRKVSKNNKI